MSDRRALAERVMFAPRETMDARAARGDGTTTTARARETREDGTGGGVDLASVAMFHSQQMMMANPEVMRAAMERNAALVAMGPSVLAQYAAYLAYAQSQHARGVIGMMPDRAVPFMGAGYPYGALVYGAEALMGGDGGGGEGAREDGARRTRGERARAKARAKGERAAQTKGEGVEDVRELQVDGHAVLEKREGWRRIAVQRVRPLSSEKRRAETGHAVEKAGHERERGGDEQQRQDDGGCSLGGAHERARCGGKGDGIGGRRGGRNERRQDGVGQLRVRMLWKSTASVAEKHKPWKRRASIDRAHRQNQSKVIAARAKES